MPQDVGGTDRSDLSPKQAARVLGVSPKTVRRACSAGLIGYRVTGASKGHWRISRRELDRFRRATGEG